MAHSYVCHDSLNTRKHDLKKTDGRTTASLVFHFCFKYHEHDTQQEQGRETIQNERKEKKRIKVINFVIHHYMNKEEKRRKNTQQENDEDLDNMSLK